LPDITSPCMVPVLHIRMRSKPAAQDFAR